MMRSFLIMACLTGIMVTIGIGYGAVSQTGEIRIGALMPLTGDWASQGAISNAGLEIARDDLNEFLEGIGSGHKINLTVEDTATDPATALMKLKEMNRSGIRLVIAATSSSELEAIRDFADANGIIVIGTASTAIPLAISGDNIIRLVPDDSNQGRAMAEVLKLEKIKAIVPIARGDIWGEGLLNSTSASFKSGGGEVVKGVIYDPGTNFSSEAGVLSGLVKDSKTKYRSDEIGVYLVSFDEATTLLTLAFRDPELSSVRWFGSDGIANSRSLIENSTASEFASKAGLVCPVYGTLPGQLIRNMSDSERITGAIILETGTNSNGYAMATYDALWVATESMMLAGSENPSQLKLALAGIGSRFTGVTGPLSLNRAGDREVVTYELVMVNETEGNSTWETAGDFRLGASGGVLNWKGETVKLSGDHQ